METTIVAYDEKEHQVRAMEPTTGNEMYLDVEKFEQAQRVAKMLATSTMVPEHFKGNIGNCMIGLNFAARVGLDPFMVLQKMYIIQGKPGIESQLMIALINKCGRFTPLKYKLEGQGKTLQCTCYATELETGEKCSQTVTWAMVEAEGWNKKKGSKWLTMPELMMQYRSAAFFGRLYCPEALLGVHTREEMVDVHQQTPNTSGLAKRLKSLPKYEAPVQEAPVQEAELVDPEPLYDTPEHKEWRDMRDMFPDLASSMPKPITVQNCIEAVKQIKTQVDKQNAE